MFALAIIKQKGSDVCGNRGDPNVPGMRVVSITRNYSCEVYQTG
jgi:hypothetical protein